MSDGQIQASSYDGTPPQRPRWFLSEVQIGNFGAFSQRAVGSFQDGLNVIYGPNEAGKSTLAAFIQGVLFGWPAARGGRNSYRSDNGLRSGRLIFCNDTGAVAQISRTRNNDGLQGDAWLIRDIDPDIFRILFAWNGDELRSLGEGSAVVSQLLTAGAGTTVPPDTVRKELTSYLKNCFSRAANQTHSLVLLHDAVSVAERKMQDARMQADEFRRANERYENLQKRCDDLNGQLATCTSQIERLKTQAALIDSLERQRDEQLLALRRIEASQATMGQTSVRDISAATTSHEEASSLEHPSSIGRSEHGLDDEATVAALRSEVTGLYEERLRRERDLSAARDSLAHAQAENDAWQRDEVYLQAAANERRTRRMQSVASIALPIITLIIGVPLFVYGNRIGSMTITAFGVALVVAAVLMGVAALIALLRPNQSDDHVARQRHDAQWIVNREQQRVQVCEKALSDWDDHARSVLAANHLDHFESLAEAKEWLDRRYRKTTSEDAAKVDRERMETRYTEIQTSCDSLQEHIDGLLADAGAADRVDLDALISHIADQRASLQRDLDTCNHQAGRLAEQLDAARDDTDLPAARQEVQDALTRFNEGQMDYARRLLAQRCLSEAISRWETTSQPAVYSKAGEVLRDMTRGEWREVRQTSEGKLEAVDCTGRAVPPEHLSLGTRQQLYLSLRIALLQVADDLGRNVPVIADDILANFDDERRMSALQALLQLSMFRQVILLTGQRSVVDLAREVCSSVNVVTLA